MPEDNTPPKSINAPNAAAPSATSPPPAGKKPAVIGAIIVLVVAVLGIGAWYLFGRSMALPETPQMMAGSQPYLYGCTTFDGSTAASTLKLSTDKKTQAYTESLAFAPTNTEDKQVDLLKKTDEAFVVGSCRIELDRSHDTKDGTFTTKSLTVQGALLQYGSTSAASEAILQFKSEDGAKTLPSFPDTSRLSLLPAEGDGTRYARAYVQHKHVVMQIVGPVMQNDLTSLTTATKVFDAIAKDAVARIDDKRAQQPFDATNVVRLAADQPMVDACRDVDYTKVTAALDPLTVQIDESYVQAYRNFDPQQSVNNTQTKSLTTACTLRFRTNEEAQAQKNGNAPVGQDGRKAAYSDNFRHTLGIDISVLESPEKAQQNVAETKKETEEAKKQGTNSQFSDMNIKDVSIGDKAFQFTSKLDLSLGGSAASSGGPLDTIVYYIADGNHVFRITTAFERQSEPYKATDYKPSEATIKKILSELKTATQRADDQSKEKK